MRCQYDIVITLTLTVKSTMNSNSIDIEKRKYLITKPHLNRKSGFNNNVDVVINDVHVVD